MLDKININNHIIIDNQYFACVNYINTLFKNTYIDFFVLDAYRKMSFRNRCMVAGSNGVVGLSVPLEKGRCQDGPFKEVKISYREDWQKQHWRTLTSCYNRSAYFEFYRDGVEKFFVKKDAFLFDLDLNILHWLKEVLRIPAEIRVVENAGEAMDKTGIIDLRDRWLPKNYQAENAGGQLKYFQVFEERIGFQVNLSILDLLFNEGPNAATLLKNVPSPV